MFGMEYLLAFIKILCNIGFAIVTAMPFNFAWNKLAPKFLYFIPEVYKQINYWEMVGLLLIITFVGECIQHLTPKIINVTQTNNNKEK